MNQIKKEDINEENIIEVLEKAGVEFEEAEVMPNELSQNDGKRDPSDFVVKLDGVYHNVDILDQPMDHDIGFKIYSKYCCLVVNLNFNYEQTSRTVLSLCEDTKKVWKTFGSTTVLIPIYSLKGITLD